MHPHSTADPFRTPSPPPAAQLNANFETLFLLLNSDWNSKHKRETIAEINGLGLNGAAFYRDHFGLVERYFAAFRARRVESSAISMLAELTVEALAVHLGVFWRQPGWFEGIESAPDALLHETVAACAVELLDLPEDIVSGLESAGYSDQTKWQVLALLQQPRTRLDTIIDAVRRNLPAFEAARAAVADELEALLGDWEARVRSMPPTSQLARVRKLGPQLELVPTLASPVAIVVLNDVAFCGLLIARLLGGDDDEFTTEQAAMAGKALGDPRKLEILLLLRGRSMYGLELANQIGITAATISHHMNLLLATGFVEAEKRDGKLFYRFNADAVHSYADWLTTHLS